MSYREHPNRLEDKRVRKLAQEYTQKGYVVSIYPSADCLPPTLANYSLDLIATNGTKVIATSVRTRENLSLNGDKDLLRISESVEKIPGWEFELVVTNSRKRS